MNTSIQWIPLLVGFALLVLGVVFGAGWTEAGLGFLGGAAVMAFCLAWDKKHGEES